MAKDLHSHAQDLARIEESDFWSKAKLKLILQEVEGKKILDVGCGSGALSKKLLEKGYNVTAIDNDRKAVDIARKKGINAYVTDITEWTTEEKFDCVIFADILEHVDRDTFLISKVYGMLKPEGCFVINVPSYQFLFGVHDVALGHKRRYSDSELKHKLESCGFKIEMLRHWNLLALPITVILNAQRKDYPHERVSNIHALSTILEKLLLAESAVNYSIGISILCKARKTRQINPRMI